MKFSPKRLKNISMMVASRYNYLDGCQIEQMKQAVCLSEEVISEWFHLTTSCWRRYRYDVRTLKFLSPDEIASSVFAQVVRYGRPEGPSGMRQGDWYRICLQDHNILAALQRDPALDLFPLLVYVFTHELVHVVRFYKFYQCFEADDYSRAKEEATVHDLTHRILHQVNMGAIPNILKHYAEHRQPAVPDTYQKNFLALT